MAARLRRRLSDEHARHRHQCAEPGLARTGRRGAQVQSGSLPIAGPLSGGGGQYDTKRPYTNNDLALSASFESAPAGVGPFTINTKLDDVMGLVSAGVDGITGNDSVLRLSYDAQFGETTQIQSVGIKGSAKF